MGEALVIAAPLLAIILALLLDEVLSMPKRKKTGTKKPKGPTTDRGGRTTRKPNDKRNTS